PPVCKFLHGLHSRTSWYSFLVQNKARRSIFSRAPTGKFPLTIPKDATASLSPLVETENLVQKPENANPHASASIRIAMLAMLASILTLGANAFAQTLPPSQYISFDAPNAGTA